MRKRNFFRRCAALALIVGSINLVTTAEAKNDFEALLADVNFGGGTAAVEQTGAALEQPPAAVPMSMPPMHDETTVAPLPPTADYDGTQYAGTSDCGTCNNGNCGGHCGGHCGSKGCSLLKEGYCQPYTPPQLPTSTFYQYWRSNACNTHVWDGFRNRCRSNIDLSIHHKPSLGCKGGLCGNGHCNGGCASGCASGVADSCGPLPAEWCGDKACDSCDGQ
ncbi:hypothetical protein NHH03_21045 [Stieleria sp. TO1_6]|uniref:hypothetical protein n=1 Tax=Stieleria tagensis TaxID=2956795 RepID=UPI00209AC0EC|nr:hypothetical protein [Stieleria tagensis]MCO8124243.1 hypothetical protein [Stieleria tagensis]